MLPDLVIAGIPVIAIIIGLVQYFKEDLGLPAKYCPGAAIGMGVLCAVVIELAKQHPVISPWVEAVVVGLVIGMAATGLYKVGSQWLKAK